MESLPFARQRQTDIFLGRLQGRRRRIPVSLPKLRAEAKQKMSPEAFAYVAGSAGLESTKQHNRLAFQQWKISPRMLRDVSTCSTKTMLFGRSLATPFLLAPIGVLEMAHQEADLAVARAAAAEGVPFIFSSQASVTMEKCGAAMGDAPRWFQLYWSTSDDLVESFVKRAEACGCEAIVLTLDTTMLGWRPRDLDLDCLPFQRGMGLAQYTADPVFQEMMRSYKSTDESPSLTIEAIRALIAMSRNYPGNFWSTLLSAEPRKAVQTFIASYSRPSLTWNDLFFLRSLTDLPILLKGILDPDDARKAIEAGMNGIIVSNHGGRQVDGAVSTISALPVIAAAVQNKIPILLDSGIRSGADIFKALALGARAVLLGRPYVYALTIAGEAGVQELIQNYRADFELTMGLAGCNSIDEITKKSLSIV